MPELPRLEPLLEEDIISRGLLRTCKYALVNTWLGQRQLSKMWKWRVWGARETATTATMTVPTSTVVGSLQAFSHLIHTVIHEVAALPSFYMRTLGSCWAVKWLLRVTVSDVNGIGANFKACFLNIMVLYPTIAGWFIILILKEQRLEAYILG